MTSDSDDLEEALRQNLKLRGELAAQVTKPEAANKRGGVAHRMGWVLYWTCLVLALCWILGLPLFWDVAVSEVLEVMKLRKDPLVGTLIHLGPAVILYALGRAFRYVLSGE